MPDPTGSKAERVPRFEVVSAALKREIVSGRFSESDVLPGERELSEMLNVSRTTLRRAIGGLIDEGVLAHRHGAGTFVRRNPPHVEQPLSRLTSFTEDMRLRGLAATSRVIDQGAFLPTPEEVMMLGIGPGERVYRLARLRLADGVPMAIDRAAAPLHFVERAQGMEELALRRFRARRLPSGARASAVARHHHRPCGSGVIGGRGRICGARHPARRLSRRRPMRRVHALRLSLRHV